MFYSSSEIFCSSGSSGEIPPWRKLVKNENKKIKIAHGLQPCRQTNYMHLSVRGLVNHINTWRPCPHTDPKTALGKKNLRDIQFWSFIRAATRCPIEEGCSVPESDLWLWENSLYYALHNSEKFWSFLLVPWNEFSRNDLSMIFFWFWRRRFPIFSLILCHNCSCCNCLPLLPMLLIVVNCLPLLPILLRVFFNLIVSI